MLSKNRSKANLQKLLDEIILETSWSLFRRSVVPQNITINIVWIDSEIPIDMKHHHWHTVNILFVWEVLVFDFLLLWIGQSKRNFFFPLESNKKFHDNKNRVNIQRTNKRWSWIPIYRHWSNTHTYTLLVVSIHITGKRMIDTFFSCSSSNFPFLNSHPLWYCFAWLVEYADVIRWLFLLVHEYVHP